MSILRNVYDVVVSGAGPVGSIAALAFSKTPYLNHILVV